MARAISTKRIRSSKRVPEAFQLDEEVLDSIVCHKCAGKGHYANNYKKSTLNYFHYQEEEHKIIEYPKLNTDKSRGSRKRDDSRLREEHIS